MKGKGAPVTASNLVRSNKKRRHGVTSLHRKADVTREERVKYGHGKMN